MPETQKLTYLLENKEVMDTMPKSSLASSAMKD